MGLPAPQSAHAFTLNTHPHRKRPQAEFDSAGLWVGMKRIWVGVKWVVQLLPVRAQSYAQSYMSKSTVAIQETNLQVGGYHIRAQHSNVAWRTRSSSHTLLPGLNTAVWVAGGGGIRHSAPYCTGAHSKGVQNLRH
jgi:hypothetical protein